ncbi:MAG: hypothetical protein ACETWK_09590 [Candidatus Aminicenantaceae bacterium]
MRIICFKIDNYSVQLYAKDRKGRRTRWGDKLIYLYSGGREVAHAVFAREGFKAPEPYFSDGKIYFFADSYQYAAVMDLLRNEKPVFIAWKPVADPKEPRDGDAYFYTGSEPKEKKTYLEKGGTDE